MPVNILANKWDPEHPPADGKRVTAHWQLIDAVRSSAALLGFDLLLVALVLRAA